MRRVLLLSALLVACALMFSGAQSPAYAKMVKGTVVSMDGGVVVLRTTEGTEESFTIGTGVQVPTGVTSGTMVVLTVGDTEGSTLVSAISVSATGSTAATPATASTPATQSGSMETPDPASADSELPETASPTMTYGLLGLLALAGGLLAKRWRTRSHA